MPELPEVESTVRYLREEIEGCRIAHVVVRWPRTISRPSVQSFIGNTRGATFVGFFRRAKFVGAELKSAKGERFYLLAHMRMTGSFDVTKSIEESKHDRVIWHLSDGRAVHFHDPRKFGRICLVKDIELITGGLGVEPLGADFTPQCFGSLLGPRRGLIKSVLLDQKIVAGIGNIYADEALWVARIHPLRSAASLTDIEVKRLHKAIQKVLIAAIAKMGTDFGDGVVEMGGYQPKAYGRGDKPCRRCRTPILRILVGQRSTHYCPTCQTEI